MLNFSRGLICSRIQRGEEEKRFIKCLESNSLTSCLILLFINEKQEKLLLQVQNDFSMDKASNLNLNLKTIDEIINKTVNLNLKRQGNSIFEKCNLCLSN